MSGMTNSEREKMNSERQAGFSLLEMLIAITIFSIVTAAIYGILEVARADRFTTNQRVEGLQSLRVAMNTMERDCHNAGFGFANTGASVPNDTFINNLSMHMPADGYGTGEDRLTPIVGGNNMTPNLALPVGQRQVDGSDQVSMLYQDTSFFQLPVIAPTPTPGPPPTPLPGGYIDPGLPKFNPNRSMRIQDISPDGATLTADTTSIANPTAFCNVGELYVVTKGRSSALGVLTGKAAPDKLYFNFGDALGINANPADPTAPFVNVRNTTGTVTGLYRVYWVTYWVRDDFALIRTVYGSRATALPSLVEDQPIAYGIENMVLNYVLENGTTDASPGKSVGGGAGGAFGTNDDIEQKVRQVIVTMTYRGSQQDQRLAIASPTPNAGYTRMTLVATFNTSNVGYDDR